MQSVNKILIIRFSSFGDIVLTSPLIRSLRAKYPDALIDFLVKSEFTELVKFNPNLSAVFELKSSDIGELRKLKKKVRNERYDIILDLHNSLRSRYVRSYSGAKKVSVIDKRIIARFALVNFKWNLYNSVVSVPARYFETARAFGVTDDGSGLEIFLPEDCATMVGSVIGKYGIDQYKNVIGLAPASRHFTKRWPQEKFVEFGLHLCKTNSAKLLIFGGKEDADYCGDIAQMINADLKQNAAVSFAGKFSLLETAAALDHCAVVVSNDTGIMHLAAARKRNVVAIFGSTVQEFGFFPYGTENIVLETEKLSCRPCSHIGRDRCPEGHFKCMKDIQVDNVLSAVLAMLQKPRN